MNSLLFAAAQAAPQATPPQAAPGGLFGSPWVMILLMFAIFYFMLIRPQQRKEKERRKMIAELRAGAKVVFAGGLMGTIVEAKEQSFKIEIATGVAVEVSRAAVQTVLPAEEPAKK